MITKNTLLRVAGALVVSAVLGSMPALADDDNRGKRVQCMVYSAFMWIGGVDQTEFDLLLTVNGEGFAKKGRTPVVKIAGKVLSPERILESADTSITINLQDYGVLGEVVGDKLTQRTDPSLAVGFTIEIEPTRKRRTHCLPFAFSGVVQKPPPINPDERPGALFGLFTAEWKKKCEGLGFVGRKTIEIGRVQEIACADTYYGFGNVTELRGFTEEYCACEGKYFDVNQSVTSRVPNPPGSTTYLAPAIEFGTDEVMVKDGRVLPFCSGLDSPKISDRSFAAVLFRQTCDLVEATPYP